MGHIYDIYGNMVQNRLYLANPQKNYLGEIYNAKEIEFVEDFTNMFELSFLVYEYENGEYAELFDEIENKRLIEFQFSGWYQIDEVQVLQEEDSIYRKKKVKCVSLENELVDKRLDYIEGVYSLYDVTNTEYSLLHLIASLTNWKIGHIDNELIGKKRTFDIDSTKIYNFLTTDVSKSFECIFKFDTYSKTISAYKLSNYGTLTNIIISGENILKNYEQVSKGSEIITKMRIQGASDVDIRDVNPTASNYLINIDYFLNTRWMSQELIDAFKTYQVAYQNILTTYNSNRTLLKNQLAELATLNAQLTDLEGLKKAQEEVQGAYIQTYNGTPSKGTNEYTLYLNATNLISSYVSQIAAKKKEVSVKEAQINATKVILEDIGANINMSNYFTSAQLDELGVFLIEGDTYQDETFVITDTMTDAEVLEMKIELMQNGANELARASQPQFTTTISANNLFTMMDESNSIIPYSDWVTQFEVGNLITIRFREDYFVTVRLVKKEFDYDNPTELQLTFSNKDRFEDELILLQDIMAQAGKTASTISLNKYGYDQASSITNEVRDFMNGTFDATLNKMRSNENEEFIITPYGAMMKRWLPDQNKYSDYQSWWTGNTLLFSSDGFKTAQTGIGLFTETNGSTFYGVLGSVIVGELFIGEKLKLTGSGASLDLSANNAITGLSAQITADINGLSASFSNTLKNYSTTVEVNSLFNQTASQIELMVKRDNIINAINVSTEGIAISGDKLDLMSKAINIKGTMYIDLNNGSTAIYGVDGATQTKIISYDSYSDFYGTWNTLILGQTGTSIGTRIRGASIGSYASGTNRILGSKIELGVGTSSYNVLSINSDRSITASGSGFTLGSSSKGFEGGYFDMLKVKTSTFGFTSVSVEGHTHDTLSNSSNYSLTLDSSRNLVPSSNSTSYPFGLGTSSYPFTTLYVKNIYHQNNTLGFYGKSPISRQSVSSLSSSAELSAVITKVNEIITKLGSGSGVGLFSTS